MLINATMFRRKRNPIRSPLIQHSIIGDGATDAADQFRTNQNKQALQRIQREEHRNHPKGRIFEHHIECAVCAAIREHLEHQRKLDDFVARRVAKEVRKRVRQLKAMRRPGEPRITKKPQAQCHTLTVEDEDGGPARTVSVCVGADNGIRSAKLLAKKKPKGKSLAKLG